MLNKKKKRATKKKKITGARKENPKNETQNAKDKENNVNNLNSEDDDEPRPGPSKSAQSSSTSDELFPLSLTEVEKPLCSSTFKQVKRIFSPFNKFETDRKPVIKGKSGPAIQSIYYSQGLTSKERSYVVSTCSTKTVRYQQLKELASKAIRGNKIFMIYSNGTPVRKALVERGWVEKFPRQRMNLNKIRQGKYSSKSNVNTELERLFLSNTVEKHYPDFVWTQKEDRIDPRELKCNTIINKLKIDGLWTTKQGLCSVMKDNYWFYIEDVSEVLAPRTYTGNDSTGEIDEFVGDFKLTACTSLLKWVLSMVANDKPVFLSCGKIALNVIVFALNRCKEFLFRKQNRDIDKMNSGIATTPVQWNTFLKKYYKIIAKQEVFEEDRENKLPLYMGYAKLLLKEIYKIRPQLSCEGCHNIWIIKPSHNCRGRGIRISSKLGVITDLLRKHEDNKFVIQKYIEEPLLIHDTKFDIRQYYLITSTYPLVIWMYKDCYLKFSSQKYNLKNYHESIHLTNNAVQKNYRNCTGRHPDLPQQNMWHSDTYKNYLLRVGKEKVWDSIIYPGMKKAIVAILLTCQDQIAVTKNRFELYGCDFLLDKEYRPWLIEMNSCPDLNPTTAVTAKICPEVMTDIIKVVIDQSRRPGKFECIYRQPITMPRYGTAVELYVRGKALPNEYFYRGKVPLQGYCFGKVTKEKDLNVLMNRLRNIFDRDLMRPPDDYEYDTVNCGVCNKNYKKVDSTKTDDEEDVRLEASIINEQLDEILKKVKSVSQSSTNQSCDDFIEHCLKSVRSFAPPPNGVLDHDFSRLDDKSSVDTSEEDNGHKLHDGSSVEPIQDNNVKESDDEASTDPTECSVNYESDTKPIQEEIPSKLEELKNKELNREASDSSDKSNDFFYIRSTSKQTQPSESPHSPQSVIHQKVSKKPSIASVSVREATMKLFDFLDRKEQEYKKSRI